MNIEIEWEKLTPAKAVKCYGELKELVTEFMKKHPDMGKPNSITVKQKVLGKEFKRRIL